jgi:lactoylglutathione lyase
MVETMPATLRRAFGYQGNEMDLPVASVEAAIPFYEQVLGFRVISREDAPQRAAVLARDDVRIRLAENGADATQDGCAFHVDGVTELFEEFQANGLAKKEPVFDLERREDGSVWNVFYVVAPDGLCYWFGERQREP